MVSSYTFSRNLSDAPDFRAPLFESAIPQDNDNLRNEWGLSCDLRHRLVASMLYQLPFTLRSGWAVPLLGYVISDWNLAAILQMQSGFPYTISVLGDTANAGTLLGEDPVRANAVPGMNPTLPRNERTTDHRFNTAAFVAPPGTCPDEVGRSAVGAGLAPALFECGGSPPRVAPTLRSAQILSENAGLKPGATPVPEALVEFHEPQRAITPGQAAVFYLGDEVLGGGWIAQVLP